jgi:50S ribosomal protein L16 3-hydroxylase
MDVQSLFGDVPVAKFVHEYLHRLPFALDGSARGSCELGGWDALGVILAAEGAEVMVVREGRQANDKAPANVEEARALSRKGHTIVVRHAERQHAGIATLARAFEETFRGPVDVQMFVTPASSGGFSWHYDAEDVFILQTAGEKEYGLRKNTVNPWPLEETLPQDMRYEREIMPLMRVTLKTGDLLYVPCGYWHRADAAKSEETAISLAVGVMSRSAVDVFDGLRREILDSLLWRQRLPLGPPASARSAEEAEATYRELFAGLANDLAKRLGDPRFMAEFSSFRSSPLDGEG